MAGLAHTSNYGPRCVYAAHQLKVLIFFICHVAYYKQGERMHVMQLCRAGRGTDPSKFGWCALPPLGVRPYLLPCLHTVYAVRANQAVLFLSQSDNGARLPVNTIRCRHEVYIYHSLYIYIYIYIKNAQPNVCTSCDTGPDALYAQSRYPAQQQPGL